jgi:hypothetical protein
MQFLVQWKFWEPRHMRSSQSRVNRRSQKINRSQKICKENALYPQRPNKMEPRTRKPNLRKKKTTTVLNVRKIPCKSLRIAEIRQRQNPPRLISLILRVLMMSLPVTTSPPSTSPATSNQRRPQKKQFKLELLLKIAISHNLMRISYFLPPVSQTQNRNLSRLLKSLPESDLS